MIGTYIAQFVDLIGDIFSIGLACVLVGIGGYLAIVYGVRSRVILVFGLILIVAGIVIGAFMLGRQSGAAACESKWQALQLQEQIARLQREAEAKKDALAARDKALDEIRASNDAANRELADYAKKAANFDKCRLATDDDLCRLRAIDAGTSTARCDAAKRVR
jgi:hypothetical protein